MITRLKPSVLTVPLLVLFLLLFIASLCQLAHGEESRKYHPISISVMAAENPADWKKMHTHIEVTGFVTYVKKEEDGDMHIRLCDSLSVKGMNRQHCIVAEAVPQSQLPRVRKGQSVTVRGISRFDAERNHNFWECHPVEGIVINANNH